MEHQGRQLTSARQKRINYLRTQSERVIVSLITRTRGGSMRCILAGVMNGTSMGLSRMRLSIQFVYFNRSYIEIKMGYAYNCAHLGIEDRCWWL